MFGRKKKGEKLIDTAWTPAEKNWEENQTKRYLDAAETGTCPQCGRPTGPMNSLLPGGWHFRSYRDESGKLHTPMVPQEAHCMTCERFSEGRDRSGIGPT